MHRFSNSELTWIEQDISARGIHSEDLRDDLLDHICCVIEQEKPDHIDLTKFYESILPRFFDTELKEIQEETDKLLTFKDFYAMKKTLKIAGITTAILVLFGAIFKTFHWPGAGVMIVLGGMIFSLIFLPLMIILKFRDEERMVDKVVLSIGFAIGMAMSMGVLFKLMHWPYATALMRWGSTAFVFGYVPTYYLTRFRRPEIRFNTTVNAILMMVCGGLLYSLINLGYSKKVQRSLYASDEYVNHQVEQLVSANANLVPKEVNDKYDQELQKASKNLYQTIEDIKINLVAKIEKVSPEDARKMRTVDMKNPSDYYVLKMHFTHAEGRLGWKGLSAAIHSYNQAMNKRFPEKPEKQIALDKLQLNDTMAAIALHELSQIQLQVVSNENSYLSYLAQK